MHSYIAMITYVGIYSTYICMYMRIFLYYNHTGSNSYSWCLLGLTVIFTQNQYMGSEANGFIAVHLEVVGGTFVNPFSVGVTLLEQSPVSAEGNNVMSIIIILCVEWRVFD